MSLPHGAAGTLDRDSATALYLQIAADLASRIGREEGFQDRLPTEAELVARYGVSRITVRLALDHLTRRGLVVRRQGRGTFVAPAHQGQADSIQGFTDILTAQGLQPETTLLAFGAAEASPEIAEALGLAGREALLLRRLYRLEDRPVALAEVYYPPDFAAHFGEADAARHSSSTLLTQFAHVQVSHADVSIRVEPSTPLVARSLELDPGTAIMLVRRITHCGDAGPVEYSTIFARAGVAEFSLTNGAQMTSRLIHTTAPGTPPGAPPRR